MVLTRGQLQRAAADQGSQPSEPCSQAIVPAEAAQPAVLQELTTNVPPPGMPQKEDTRDPPAAQMPPMAKKPVGEDRPLKPLPAVAQQTDKLPDGPEPVAVEIQYVPREELTPVGGDLAAALAGAAAALTAADWVAVCGGLTTVRQLAVHGPADLLIQQLATLVPAILKSVRSLRSALTKTAIMTVGDLYLSLGDAMLAQSDIGGAAAPATSLLCSLLLKAGSTEKQFVVVEAQRALECMADSLDAVQLTPLLLPYTEHKNPKVRGQAARTLARSQARLQGQAELGVDLATLLGAAGRLLTDNTPEAREGAKKLLALVQAGFAVAPPATDAQPAPAETAAAGDEDDAPQPTPWESFCRAVLPGSTAIAVLKQVLKEGC